MSSGHSIVSRSLTPAEECLIGLGNVSNSIELRCEFAERLLITVQSMKLPAEMKAFLGHDNTISAIFAGVCTDDELLRAYSLGTLLRLSEGHVIALSDALSEEKILSLMILLISPVPAVTENHKILIIVILSGLAVHKKEWLPVIGSLELLSGAIALINSGVLGGISECSLEMLSILFQYSEVVQQWLEVPELNKQLLRLLSIASPEIQIRLCELLTTCTMSKNPETIRLVRTRFLHADAIRAFLSILARPSVPPPVAELLWGYLEQYGTKGKKNNWLSLWKIRHYY